MMRANDGARWLWLVGMLLLTGWLANAGPTAGQEIDRPQPRNVILIIGSGMGPEHVEAARLTANPPSGRLAFEEWGQNALLNTQLAQTPLPDPAAAATALATGADVQAGVLSLSVPGDGQPLETLLEFYQAQCKRTALVTSGDLAAPPVVAFATHLPGSTDVNAVWQQFGKTIRPNLLFGGGTPPLSADQLSQLGYALATTRLTLVNVPDAAELLVGAFGSDGLPYQVDFAAPDGSTSFDMVPHLSELTREALDRLEDGPNGFFLVVAGARIAEASVANETARVVYEIIELADAAAVAHLWAQEHPDTLIVVTGDFEAGGLATAGTVGADGLPDVTWSARGTTTAPVPVYAWGTNADLVQGSLTYADLHAALRAGQPNPLADCGPSPIPTPGAPPTATAYPGPFESAESPTDDPYPAGSARATRDAAEFMRMPTRTPEPPDGATPVRFLPRRVTVYPLLLLAVIGVLALRLWRHRSRP